MIEIGFSNNIYDNPRDVVGCIAGIAREFRAVEIEIAEEAQTAILDGAPGEYQEIVHGLRSLRADGGLAYSVHAPWFGANTDYLSASLAERERAVNVLAQSLQFAADIDAEVVTFHPGKSAKRENPELIEILCHGIAGVASEAKQASIALCLENMGAERPGFPIFSPEEHLRICDQAGIEICLDVPHLASVYPQFADTESAIRLMAPHIRHVHLGDTELPHHKHLPIGMGDLRVADVLEVLQNCAYDGHAIVEEFNRGWAPEEYWRRAVQFRDSFVYRSLHGV